VTLDLFFPVPYGLSVANQAKTCDFIWILHLFSLFYGDGSIFGHFVGFRCQLKNGWQVGSVEE
jgi:hypothetical protein